jgi:hypothetical protein
MVVVDWKPIKHRMLGDVTVRSRVPDMLPIDLAT